jgi:hypothetical protein
VGKTIGDKNMKYAVRYTSPGGETLDVEVDNGATIEEVFAAAGKLISGKVSLNGEPASPDTPVQEGDIVGESKTAEGA